MFAREYRLPATVRFTNTRFLKTSDWSVKFCPNNLDHNRYGFVIRKQVDKRAVIRNRIKRLFRAGVESIHPELKTGYDMLFFLEKGIMEKQQGAVTDEIRLNFTKQHLFA